MLDGRTNEPDVSGLGLDVQPTASVDGGLGVVGVVNIVVGNPEPVVFHVQALRAEGDVHAHKGGDTITMYYVNGAGGSRALGDLEVGAREAADTGVDVPHSGGGASVGEIVFDQDGAGLSALGGDDHVGPFNGAALTRLTDLDDWPRVPHVGEVRAAGHDDRIRFSDDSGASWDTDGVGDFVNTRVEKDNLSRAEGVIDGVGVVGHTVTPRTSVTSAEEVSGGILLILRLGALIVSAAGEKRFWPVVGGDGSFKVVGAVWGV